MQVHHAQLPWQQPDCLENVTAWIHDHLAAANIHPTGAVELLHQRPWSSFARITTGHGIVYFKAPAPAFTYEAAVTQALAGWRPDCTVPLLAVDLDQGWMLSLDAGVTLRTASPSADQVEDWVRILPFYVDLQIEMAARVPELLALGMPDRRLAILPTLYTNLLASTADLRVGQDAGLTPDEYQRLLDLRPEVAALCAQLASYGLPATLTHEEVHDANVLVSGNHCIFTDWSDASVAHPFFTILVTLRAAAHRLKLAEDGPAMLRVRDAYLEPWTRFTTRSEISSAFTLAYRLAMINRALSWQQGLSNAPEKEKAPYADSVPGWLQDFLISFTQDGL